MKPHFKPFSYFLYKFDGLVARHLDAFLVNSITNMDAFLLNFRCDYQSFAMKKGYDFLKFRVNMQNGDEFGKKTKHNEQHPLFCMLFASSKLVKLQDSCTSSRHANKQTSIQTVSINGCFIFFPKTQCHDHSPTTLQVYEQQY